MTKSLHFLANWEVLIGIHVEHDGAFVCYKVAAMLIMYVSQQFGDLGTLPLVVTVVNWPYNGHLLDGNHWQYLRSSF